MAIQDAPFLLVTADPEAPNARVLTTDVFASNLQFSDSGVGGTFTLAPVLNLESLVGITSPGLTTYIGANEFVSRSITSTGSILVTDPAGTAGNIILSVVDHTSIQKVGIEVGGVSHGAESTLNFIAGNNMSINAVDTGSTVEITFNAIGGGGSGTVTSISEVAGQTECTPNPITTTGTIGLATTAVTAGSYTNTNLTVDAFGRITLASNGSGGGGDVIENPRGISVGATANLPSTNTTFPSFLVGKSVGSLGTTVNGGNVIIGSNSLTNNTTGAGNISLGTDALRDNTTGFANFASGLSALRNNTLGQFNIGLGQDAGILNLGGNNNIYIGASSGSFNINGDNNVCLGANAGPTSANLTNTVSLGGQAAVSASNTVVLGNLSDVSVVTGNTFAEATAKFQIDSITKGFLEPRMTTSERNLIVSPADGLQVYDITDKTPYVYRTAPGSGWTSMIGGGGGGGFTSIVTQIFTASGTYTPTAGMKYCFVQLCGGGGSGASRPAIDLDKVCGGGSGGGYAQRYLLDIDVLPSLSVTVGLGGAAVTNAGGNAGGITSVGALVSATGGGGGLQGAGSNPGGNGTNPNAFNLRGQDASITVSYGGGVYDIGVGGSSFFGPSRSVHIADLSAAGENGRNPGEGGTASLSLSVDELSGAGADGIVIITEYII